MRFAPRPRHVPRPENGPLPSAFPPGGETHLYVLPSTSGREAARTARTARPPLRVPPGAGSSSAPVQEPATLHAPPLAGVSLRGPALPLRLSKRPRCMLLPSRVSLRRRPPPDPSAQRPPILTSSRGNQSKVAPAGSAPRGQADQFTKSALSRAHLRPSPALQFKAWFADAQASASPQPEACTLSTAELPAGRVSSRTVYLKELDARGGYVVYSNLGTSRKAADLATNPHAALVFYWPALQRQVRVEGLAARTSREESQLYFDTRLRGSRIGAWASRQSVVLEPARGRAGGAGAGHDGNGEVNRKHEDEDEADEGQDDGRARLEEWVAEAEKKFDGVDRIPVPDFWGGLRIVPTRIEFWQGRESRLHDRFVYERDEGRDGKDDEWTIQRLSP